MFDKDLFVQCGGTEGNAESARVLSNSIKAMRSKTGYLRDIRLTVSNYVPDSFGLEDDCQAFKGSLQSAEEKARMLADRMQEVLSKIPGYQEYLAKFAP